MVARARDCLNLRAGPSREAAVLTGFPDGTPLELFPRQPGNDADQSARRADDALWVRVTAPDGRTGWVNSAYLDWA